MSAELQPMVSAKERHRQRRDQGFSLVELGIVIAVIAVISGVVIAGAGFLRAARQRTAADLVLSIRSAARQHSVRHHRGLFYGLSAAIPGTPQEANVNLDALRNEGFLPQRVKTPWQSAEDATISIRVQPSLGVPPVALCAGFSCVQIQMDLPPGECVVDPNGQAPFLVDALRDKAVGMPVCAGNTLTVVMR